MIVKIQRDLFVRPNPLALSRPQPSGSTGPASAAPGGATFTLAVNGNGFVSGSVVNWNGSPRTTTFVNSHRLTAAINASDIATPATVSITVNNPPTGGGLSNAVYFPVLTQTPSVFFAGRNIPASGGPSPIAVTTASFRGTASSTWQLDITIARSRRRRCADRARYRSCWDEAMARSFRRSITRRSRSRAV